MNITLHSLADSHFLAGLVDKHRAIIDYLLINASDYATPEKWIARRKAIYSANNDSLSRQHQFIESVRNDQKFNQFFIPFVNEYLADKEYKISDFVKPPVWELGKEQLMQIAARFYYVSSINADGKIRVNNMYGCQWNL